MLSLARLQEREDERREIYLLSNVKGCSSLSTCSTTLFILFRITLRSLLTASLFTSLILLCCLEMAAERRSYHSVPVVPERTYTVPSQSLESPSWFSISARVNFHFVFWLPKFEILREINADLISGSKHLFLFAGFF